MKAMAFAGMVSAPRSSIGIRSTVSETLVTVDLFRLFRVSVPDGQKGGGHCEPPLPWVAQGPKSAKKPFWKAGSNYSAHPVHDHSPAMGSGFRRDDASRQAISWFVMSKKVGAFSYPGLFDDCAE